MRLLILFAILIVSGAILGSCDNGQRSSDSELKDDGSDLNAIGRDYCDVHQRECEVERIRIAVIDVSFPRSYYELRQSEEYRAAQLQTFPKARTYRPYTAQEIAHLPKEEGQNYKGFYCLECRESEQAWLSQQANNKKQNKAEESTPNPPSD